MRRAALVIITAVMTWLTPSSAQAQFCINTCGGFYLGVFGGVMVGEDLLISTDVAAIPAVNTLQGSWDIGFVTGASVGYEWPNGLAFETEVGYHRMEIDEVLEPTTPAVTDGDGQLEIVTVMINVLYYCGSGECSCGLRPYFGAGGGLAWNRLENNSLGEDFNGDYTPCAWQLLAGIELVLNPCARVHIQYRNLNVAECNWERAPGSDRVLSRGFLHVHEAAIGCRFIIAG